MDSGIIYTDAEVRAKIADLLSKRGAKIALARKLGISPMKLSGILHGRDGISWQVLRWLGVKRIICYTPGKQPKRTTRKRDE